MKKTTNRIELGRFTDPFNNEVWLEIGAEPVLCWKAPEFARSPINKVRLASLLDIAITQAQVQLGGGIGDDATPLETMPGIDKARFVAAALAALAKPYSGHFEIRWVPDDGLPF